MNNGKKEGQPGNRLLAIEKKLILTRGEVGEGMGEIDDMD